MSYNVRRDYTNKYQKFFVNPNPIKKSYQLFHIPYICIYFSKLFWKYKIFIVNLDKQLKLIRNGKQTVTTVLQHYQH